MTGSDLHARIRQMTSSDFRATVIAEVRRREAAILDRAHDDAVESVAADRGLDPDTVDEWVDEAADR